MSIDAIFKEQADEAKPEVAPIDKDAQFDMAIKTLLYYQHRITDIASVAARFISEARGKYNHFLDLYKPFLKEHALEHLKRNKDGQIKGKNYKSLSAGGGVFFRAKPEKITFNKDNLWKVHDFISSYLPERASELLVPKVIYEISDEETLIATLTEIAEIKAKEVFTDPEEITVGTVAGMQEILDEFGIEIEPEDPFASMYIGSSKAFTGRDIKANLTQAVDGTSRYDQEEEIDLLIEDLS